MSEIHRHDSEQLSSQADIMKVLQGIFNILDESMGRNGLSRKIEYRKPDEGSVTSDIQVQHHNRVLLNRTLSELEASFMGAEKALVLLPGSETITAAISYIIRSIDRQKYDQELSPFFLDDFGKGIVKLEDSLGILRKQVPAEALSAEETISIYISCLRRTHELCKNFASDVHLMNSLQNLIHATDRFSLSAAPYLADRRRSMKDSFLTVSKISALFCTMPSNLVNSQSIPTLATREAVSLLAYISTTFCTAAFISAYMIARFLDGETLDIFQTFTLRWTLRGPLLFLAMGAFSFFTAFTLAIAQGGGPNLWVSMLIVTTSIAALLYVAWRLRNVSSAKDQEMHGIEIGLFHVHRTLTHGMRGVGRRD